MSFTKLNLNPKEKKTSDCVVRAIACGTGQSWEKVYQDLCRIGLEEYEMPNSKTVWQKYLNELGWKKQPMPKIKFGNTYRRVRLEAFAKDIIKNSIVSVASHLTCVEDGSIIDTWNCGHKSVGNYWTK